MLFWSESEYVTLFYCFFLFLIIFLGLLFASFFFGCFFVFGLIVSFSKILLKFLSFLFTIIFGLIFLLVLVLLFMFVLDYLWLDYYLDYLFVTPEGLQFDINNRLGEYLQSLNNSDTANEVTKNVSEGAGKDVKDVIKKKQSFLEYASRDLTTRETVFVYTCAIILSLIVKLFTD